MVCYKDFARLFHYTPLYNLTSNERVCLFDIEGHSIANVQAKNGSISLKTKPNSIMVVRIGNRSIKVICE